MLEEIAVSPTHTPALYARLLRSLLSPNSAESTPLTRAPSPIPGTFRGDDGEDKHDGPSVDFSHIPDVTAPGPGGAPSVPAPTSADWRTSFQSALGADPSYGDEFSAAFGDGLGAWTGERDGAAGNMFGLADPASIPGGGEDEFGFFPMTMDGMFESMLLPVSVVA